MEEEVILIVSKHKYLDSIILPCLVQKKSDQGFFSVAEILRPQSTSFTSGQLPSALKQMVEWASKTEDKALVEAYSKKKLHPKDFFETVDKEIFTSRVKPFVESMHVRLLDAAAANNIRLYVRKENANIYPEDLVTTENNEPGIIFSFDRNDLGLTYEQSLSVNGKSISLLSKPYFILSNNPCKIIISNILYSTSAIESRKLVPFFTKKHIVIPKKMEKDYFDTFILNAVTKYQVKAKGFVVDEVKLNPRFILTIDRDLAHNACFILTFKYGSRTLEFGKKQPLYVEYTTDNDTYTYTKMVRDFQLENEFYAQLNALGLVADKHNFLKVQSFAGDGVSETYDWLSKNIEFLESNNVSVMSSGKKHVMISKPLLLSECTENNDWFDLKASVSIGHHVIPFVMLRSHIMRGTREFIYANEVFVIPSEWFAQFTNLFLFGKQEGDSISIQAHHLVSTSNMLENSTSVPVKRLLKLLEVSKEEVAVPSAINATLRPYQRMGFNWLCNLLACNLGGCLADDMGLGKTLQTIALIAKINENAPSGDSTQEHADTQDLFGNSARQPAKKKTVLIVMPSSLVHNWFNEFKKFAPSLQVHKHVGQERGASPSTLAYHDVVLTTYGLVRNDAEMLQQVMFHAVVLDESQVVKNPESKTYEAVRRLKSKHKLVLTGTPIENGLEDLWAQLNFVNPGMLGSLKFFRENFVEQIKLKNSDKADHLKRLVAPFILRRHKQDVLTELPSLQEQIVYCKMSDEQESMYEAEKSKARNILMDSTRNKSINVLQQLLKLRQIANNPLLVDEGSTVDSGKFDEVTRSLQNVVDEDHKVLLFSSFVRHLEIFEAYLRGRNTGYVMLTGETRDREGVVRKFQEDPDVKVFLISIKAGGTGLNLTQADYVFLLDPWWNPAVEEQAVARAYRMGQTNKVFVYRFISENTIEEKIRMLQETKSKLADAFVDENNFEFNEETMQYLLG